MKKIQVISIAATAFFLMAMTAWATPITFSGSSGNLSASASFTVVGNNLQVVLTNTSPADVMIPADLLTAVFFNVSGATLTPVSAMLNGSTVNFGSSNNGDVGGEWAYASGLSGAPGAAASGISSTGLGLFGPGDLFGGTNLQGPVSPDGMQYGIASAGDNPATGNPAVTGGNALIQNSVTFLLSGIPAGFDPGASIGNVFFQYGTDLNEPSFGGGCVGANCGGPTVPEPTSLLLFGTGLAALGLATLRKRNK